jgi:crotonobetainyl-CoA:carnitine CoA-transferase CaiB-like acyl-CoA transferase
MTLPLTGVTILAVEQYGAGPFGTMFLADQGAEVIKIENPNAGGDFARDIGPYFFTPDAWILPCVGFDPGRGSARGILRLV